MRAAFSPPPKQPINSNAKTNGPPIEGPGSSSLSEAGPLDEESHAVSPSLLKPLDTSTALEAQRAGQIEDSASRAGISEYTSERSGFATDRSTPVPLTPDQAAPMKDPQSTFSERQRISSGPSDEKQKRQKVLPMQLKGQDTRKIVDWRSEWEKGNQNVVVGQSTLGSDELDKIEGQDSLEVRQVTLANGQVASLILEEGRLQRIVSSNGQIAELQWQPPPTRIDTQVNQQPLTIKMHRGVAPTPNPGSNDAHPVPGSIKRWANALTSQRLSNSEHGSDFFTSYGGRSGMAVAAGKARSSMDVRSIKSVEVSGGMPGAGTAKGRRRVFVSSLLSMPNGKAASQSTPGMTVDEREIKGAWNPMNENWLPKDMTSIESQIQNEGSEQGKVNRQKRAQSSDLIGLQSRVQNSQQQADEYPVLPSVPPVKSQFNPIFDSNTESRGQHGPKKGLWKSLKRILQMPSSSKQPGSPGSVASVAQSARSGRRFSLAQPSGHKVAEASSSEQNSQGQQNSSSLSTRPNEAVNHKIRSRSTSQYQPVGRNAATAFLPERLDNEPDINTLSQRGTQEPEVRRNLAADLAVLDQQQDSQTAHLSSLRQASEREVRYETERDLDLISAGSTRLTGRPTAASSTLLHRATDLQPGPARSQSLGEQLTEIAPSDWKSDANMAQAKGPINYENRLDPERRSPSLAGPKQRTLMAGKWQKNFTEGTSGVEVDNLLHVSSLQRLARERIVEMQIVETDNTLELIWHIPLNGSSSKISKTDRYLKNGEVVEAARRDGRPGLLRSQLTFTPEGHVHIRALQGEPYSAVFHDRIKLSTGGRRIKFEQKFQLLQPGVPPVKYFSIWHRIE